MATLEDGREESNRELKDSIDRLTMRLEQSAKVQDALTKNIYSGMRLAVGSSILYGGVAASREAARRAGGFRNLAMRSAAIAGLGPGQGAAAALVSGSRTARLLTAIRFIGPIGLAVAGLAAAVRSMRGGRGGRGGAGGSAMDEMVDISNRQLQIMQDQLRQTIATRQTFETATAMRFARADVFQRGLQYQRRRSAALGLIPIPGEVEQIGSAIASEQNLSQRRMARERAEAALTAPYRDVYANVRSLYEEARQMRARGQAAMGEMPDLQAGLQLMGGIPRVRALQSRFRQGLIDFNFGPTAEQQFQMGRQNVARMRRTDLNLRELERFGPATAQGPSPTVFGGDEAEYRFRVQQQQMRRNIEATRIWQDRVLDALRTMVKQGQIQPDDLENRQTGFGRGVEVRVAE